MTDYPDFATPQAHATAIAGTGVPLLSSPATLVNLHSVTIPGGNTNFLSPVTFTQVGYALQITANFPAGATNPFCTVELQWTDPVTSLVYDDAHYIIAGASSVNGYTTLGNGPARSGQLTIGITNLDPSQTVTLNIQLAQDSSIRTVDRWYGRTAANIAATVPAYTLATLSPDEDVLGILHGATIPASSSATWLFGMAPGRTVQLTGAITTTPVASLQLFVIAVPSGVYTSIAGVVRAIPPVAQFSYTFIAPRSHLTVVLVNSSATAGTLDCFMNALE